MEVQLYISALTLCNHTLMCLIVIAKKKKKKEKKRKEPLPRKTRHGIYHQATLFSLEMSNKIDL